MIERDSSKDLHLKVFNVSQHGQHWEATLADVLQTRKIAVTDILMLGKMSALISVHF